tara:strand:- start:7536 stop:8396 length:861 start_codon:yes stop_codon:yes gene_type:complete
MQFNLRKLANWAGTTIAILAVVYVTYLFNQYSAEIDFTKFSVTQWLMFGVFTLIYGAANFFLASSWRNILEYLSAPISFIQAIRIFGISQLAKYLPGNILHLAGRQAMGMARGIPAMILVKSAGWEFILIALVGSLFGILILPIFFSVLANYVAIVFFIAAIMLIGWILFRFFGQKILHAYFSYLIFLSISGVIFATLLALISGAYDAHYHSVIAAFVIAWLAGLITPGAPAGIGIRELVLLFLLKGIILGADILIAVVLGRLVTVFGDLIFYLYSIIIGKVTHCD